MLWFVRVLFTRLFVSFYLLFFFSFWQVRLFLHMNHFFSHESYSICNSIFFYFSLIWVTNSQFSNHEVPLFFSSTIALSSGFFPLHMHVNAAAQDLLTLKTVCYAALCFMAGCKFPTHHCNPVCQTRVILFVLCVGVFTGNVSLPTSLSPMHIQPICPGAALIVVCVQAVLQMTQLYLVKKKKNLSRHLPRVTTGGEVKLILTF